MKKNVDVQHVKECQLPISIVIRSDQNLNIVITKTMVKKKDPTNLMPTKPKVLLSQTKAKHI